MGDGTGPRVVAVGGGHGLAVTLRALRRYAGSVTAVVSVADDGGSSGRLREFLDLPAPGDLRRCLAALADPASPWATAIEHRFAGGDVHGHALGNLMIAALAECNGGFLAAIEAVERLVGAVGRVLPATTEPVALTATVPDADTGTVRLVEGQVAITQVGPIDRVALRPEAPSAPPEAIKAIDEADQVVLGPGSLFTSLLAATAVPDITAALQRTPATKVLVANLGEQVRETLGLTLADHLAALDRHGVPVDVALCQPGALAPGDLASLASLPRLVEHPVARPDRLAHDPEQLAAALADLVG